MSFLEACVVWLTLAVTTLTERQKVHLWVAFNECISNVIRLSAGHLVLEQWGRPVECKDWSDCFCRKSWSWSLCWEQGCCVGLHWLSSFLRGSTHFMKKSLKVKFIQTVFPSRTAHTLFPQPSQVQAKVHFIALRPVNHWKETVKTVILKVLLIAITQSRRVTFLSRLFCPNQTQTITSYLKWQRPTSEKLDVWQLWFKNDWKSTWLSK